MTTGASPSHYVLSNSEAGPLRLPDANKNVDEKQALTRIYESHARIYPNPRLTEERLERDRLMSEVQKELDEAEREREKDHLNDKPRKRGFLSYIFGSSDEDVSSKSKKERKIKDEDYIVYEAIRDETIENESGSLCGTQTILDLECIPSEANSLARFHLSSQQTPVEICGDGSPILILDIGVIAELSPITGKWEIRFTSDKSELERYLFQRRDDYHLCHARGTKITSNCFAVSWGWLDGIVVIYRRIQGFSEDIEWDAVALVTATGAVLSNLQSVEDVFLQQDDTGTLSSQLLRVTGTKSLVIETSSGDNIVILAVSRLGGYLEFIPLASNLWHGPILTPQSHKIEKRRNQGRGSSKHYAIGHVLNVASDVNAGICALTIGAHLVDILNIEAYRTPVSSLTKWDQNAFPHFPPAEYLFVACGNAKSGEEAVTFWSVSTTLSEDTNDKGLSLLVNFLGQKSLEPIGNSTIFANNSIMDLWRKPRQVKRRKHHSTEQNHQGQHVRGTISVSTPILKISFQLLQSRILMLSLLDGNQGLTVLNCTNALEQASQKIQSEEGKVFDPKLIASVIQSRVDIQQTLNGKAIRCVKWTGSGELVVATCGNRLQLLKFNANSIPIASQDIILPKWVGRIIILREDEKIILLLATRSGEMSVTADFRASTPTAILKGLIKSGLYNEAIDAAKNFPDEPFLGEMVATCHKRLWEKNYLLEHLTQVTDHKYVIEQLLGLFQGIEQVPKDMLPSCRAIRHACHLGLARCSNLHVASALQLSEDIDTVKDNLMNWSTRIGTYSLLCEHFGIEEDSSTFFNKYCKDSVVALASEIATRGDINGLTIILTRHQREVGLERWRVLNNIPPAVDPVSYSHLLPVYKNEKVSTEYFSTSDVSMGFRHTSSLVDFAKDQLGIRIIFDNEDATTLLVSKERPEQDDTSLSNMISWFVQRANQIQRVVGTFSILSNFCALAIRCLDIVTSEREASAQELVAFQAFIQHMDQVMNTRRLSAPLDESLLQMNTDDLFHMPLSRLLTFLLGEPRNEFEASTRFRNHVLPVVSMPVICSRLISDNACSLDERLDEAILLHFIALLQSKLSGKNTLSAAMCVLHTCVAIAKSSRSSLKKSQRIIQGRHTLMEFVLSLCEAVSSSSPHLEPSPKEVHDILNCMWEAFEALPSHVGPDEKLIEECVVMNQRIDSLYQRLIAIDILAYWSPSNALYLLSNAQVKGSEIALVMCSAFCSHIHNHNEDLLSLHELASDLNQLQIMAYPSYADLGSTLIDGLLIKLLHLSEFELFAEVFSTDLRGKIIWEDVELTVVRFIEYIGFSDQEFETNTGDKIETVVKCQNILGSRLPQLKNKLDEICHSLNASHFISSVLKVDNGRLRPSALRDMLPFDVIEHVLRENPECILQDCKEWSDAEFGRVTLRELLSRHYLEKFSDIDSTKSLPTLPGHAIIKLANVLGFETYHCLLAIQSRLVHYLQKAAYPWAAAAIALMMLYETMGKNDYDEILVDIVCQIVDDTNYKDFLIKASLCRLILSKSHGSWSERHKRILRSFASIEHHISRFCPANWPHNINPEKNRGQSESEFAVFRAAGLLARAVVDEGNNQKMPERLGKFFSVRPIDRVFQDTIRNYSSDLNMMFQILQAKSSQCEADDPLVVALGRYHLFWCISNSVSIFETDKKNKFEQDNAFQNLLLAISLLLSSHDSAAILSNVSEMKEIAETQSRVAFEQIAMNLPQIPVRPDLGIVQKMVELGYPENGARRAAVMTNNESQQAAMIWAVAHSLDSDFDSPVVFVKSSKNLNFDQVAVQNVQRFLHLVESYFNGTRTFSLMLPNDNSGFSFERSLQLVPLCNAAATTESNGLISPKKKTENFEEKERGHNRDAKAQNAESAMNDGVEYSRCKRQTSLHNLGSSRLQRNEEIETSRAGCKKQNAAMQVSPLQQSSKEKIYVDNSIEREGVLLPVSQKAIKSKTIKNQANTHKVVVNLSPNIDQRKGIKPDCSEKIGDTIDRQKNKAIGSSPTPIVNSIADEDTTSHAPTQDEGTCLRVPDEHLKEACKISRPPPSSLPLPQSPGIKIKHAAPKSSEGVTPRLHLLRTGEDIRQKSRSINNRLGNEERERLLKKGRQLFEKARSRREAAAAIRAPSNEGTNEYSGKATTEVTAPTNLGQKSTPFRTSNTTPTQNTNLAGPISLKHDNVDSKIQPEERSNQKCLDPSASIPVLASKSGDGWSFDDHDVNEGNSDVNASDVSEGWDFDDF